MSRPELTWAQARTWRLERHRLDPAGTGGRGSAVAEVVRAVGAVASMDEAAAELTVRSRLTTSVPGVLAEAHRAGEVVKVFAFRGAVHYLAPDDGAAYLALRAAGRQWELRSWVEHYGLTAEAWPAFRAAVREALTDRPLTVAELGEALVAQPAYAHLAPVFAGDPCTLMKPLMWQGDTAFGPRGDGPVVLWRADSVASWPGIPDLEDAGPRAVTAYLRGFGPATREGVQHWLGDGLSAGRKRLGRWLDGLGDGLVEVDVEGTPALVLAGDLDDLRATEPVPSVRLLPGHDPWVMGPGTRDTHVVPAALRDQVTRKASLVLVDGVVAGTWTARGGEPVVTWAGGQPADQAAVAAEVARTAELLAR